jgi:hypothetical protein
MEEPRSLTPGTTEKEQGRSGNDEQGQKTKGTNIGGTTLLLEGSLHFLPRIRSR